MRKGSTLSYIYQDHLGGTSITESGTVDTIKYYPYGSTRSGDVTTDYKFTGQRRDGSGLYYYGARYYHPSVGRFISADTIVPNPANPQSLNRYSYCLNNPLKYTDPTGDQPEFEESFSPPTPTTPPPGIDRDFSPASLPVQPQRIPAARAPTLPVEKPKAGLPPNGGTISRSKVAEAAVTIGVGLPMMLAGGLLSVAGLIPGLAVGEVNEVVTVSVTVIGYGLFAHGWNIIFGERFGLYEGPLPF